MSMLSFSDCQRPLLHSVVQTVVADPASFHAILSVAARASARLRGEKDCLESIWHKGEAIRITNERLKNPNQRFSDDNIVAVAQLAFVDHAFGDLDSLKIHIDGLEMMVRARGGWTTFTNETLRTMLSWIDTANAILTRTGLRFAIEQLDTICRMVKASQTTPTSFTGESSDYIVVYKPKDGCILYPMIDLYQDVSCAGAKDDRFMRFSAYLSCVSNSIRTPFGLFYQYADESVGGRQDAFLRQERIRRQRGLFRS